MIPTIHLIMCWGGLALFAVGILVSVIGSKFDRPVPELPVDFDTLPVDPAHADQAFLAQYRKNHTPDEEAYGAVEELDLEPAGAQA